MRDSQWLAVLVFLHSCVYTSILETQMTLCKEEKMNLATVRQGKVFDLLALMHNVMAPSMSQRIALVTLLVAEKEKVPELNHSPVSFMMACSPTLCDT